MSRLYDFASFSETARKGGSVLERVFLSLGAHNQNQLFVAFREISCVDRIN